MIRVNRSMIAILICAIMVSLFSIKDVSADEHDRMPNLDTGRSSSLTIKFLYHDGRQAETPIPGATFSVYQVAKVATKGGGAYYEATSQFASAGINYNGMTTASSVEAAKKLEGLVTSGKIKGVGETTNASGSAVFSNLPHGIYLVRETGLSGKAKAYKRIAPYLVMVPGIEDTGREKSWIYDVVSEPKPTATKIAFSPIYANLYVKKTLEGRSLKDNMFKFRLTETDADGNKKSGGVSITKANDANGNVNFRLKYKKPGTYYYSIREIDNGIKDIKYDNKTVKAVVKIIEDGEGKLIVKRIIQSKDSTFRNKTEPDNFISKVQTGDKFALAILLGALAGSVLVIITLMRRKRKI